jgi:hypothetical protein
VARQCHHLPPPPVPSKPPPTPASPSGTHTADDIRAWRTFLEVNHIRQPFKQAHRELYLLTDAELQTGTYSNRFAGHIIRQHQFLALCHDRGWKALLQGSWDPGTDPTPTLDLPRHNLHAQFYVEATPGAGLELTGAAYLSTDQVRFYRGHPEDPTPLRDVPPLVFSEVMRDVDLFVAVCSIGADPDWANQPRRATAFDTYWRNYAFGELTPSAANRRDILSTLLPRLKIADRCALADKFLTVRGQLRTYKIHLGSGNILMEPNDQYLCIVPNRSADATADIFLPFEGDTTLAVILSKAFLLANDTKITDPTITRQINTK